MSYLCPTNNKAEEVYTNALHSTQYVVAAVCVHAALSVTGHVAANYLVWGEDTG